MRWVAGLAEFGRIDVGRAGGKAANLGELVRAGLPVPDGFVVTTEAYRRFVAHGDLGARVVAAARAAIGDEQARTAAAARISALFRAQEVDPELRTEIVGAYQRLGEPAVAVRSSATAEDLAEASFAGQQDSYLNVQGSVALLAAVIDCWASLWTSRALAYRERQGIEPDGVSLAVVVQTLVAADAAGVLFTANPANGRRGEAVISGAWGLGEAIVGGLVDPDQIVVDKVSGLLTRQTAEKSIMTVRTAAGTEERPVPTTLRGEPVLDDPTAHQLVSLGTRIETLFGVPQDIEWARTGSSLFILQSRAITALPPAEAAPPTTWVMPDPQSLYFRASIVEQLPDPLSPLFAELIDGSVTRSVHAVIAELLGGSVLRDGDIAMPTINGYAYYAYTRAGLLRLTINSPRGLRLLWGGGRLNAQVRWRTYSHPRYARTVRDWEQRDVVVMSVEELLTGVQTLLDAGTEYYTAVQTIIPIAATNEVVFTRFYDLAIKRPGDPAAATLLLGYDSVPILAEKSLFDLARWAQQHPNVREWLQDTAVEQIVARLDARLDAREDDGSEFTQLAQRFAEHLEHYGHTVYNLDFLNPVPADDPAPLVDTLKLYLRGEGSDPYERQRRTAQRREDATAKINSRLDPLRRVAFGQLLQRAQRVAPLREDALADVGLAWPALRRLLLELGRRLQTSHSLDRPDDVFWCTPAEIVANLAGPAGRETPGLTDAVERRKEIWRGQRRVTPPQMLPESTWLHLLDAMMPATATEQTGDVLSGIGASGGRITAAARILRGPEDFAGLGVGEVLVASITTPAWTPLFARAAAVVTDIGGPLSHSSIVAREYGIPAVLGTGVATRRIEDGQQVTVDGDRGRVWLGSDAPAGDVQTPSTSVDRRRRVAVALALAVGGSLIVHSLFRRHLRHVRHIRLLRLSAAPTRHFCRDTPPKAPKK